MKNRPHLRSVMKGTAMAALTVLCLAAVPSRAQTAAKTVEATKLSLTHMPLPSGAVGFRYAETFPIEGGKAPYTFVLSGNLPPGMKTVPSATTILIEGIPQHIGSYPLAVTVTDALGQRDRVDYVLEIIPDGGRQQAVNISVVENAHTNDAQMDGESLQSLLQEIIHTSDVVAVLDSAFPMVNENIKTTDTVYVGPVGTTAQSITYSTLPTPVYGNASFTVNASASSGLPVSYTLVSGPATGSNPFTITGAGNVVIRLTQSGSETYAAAAPVNVTVTVTRAVLTVTGGSVSRVFDQPNPANFSYTITGYVNSDGPGVVSGAPFLGTTALGNSPPGSYAILVFVNHLSATNYSFSPVNGTLTVNGGASQSIFFFALPTLSNAQTMQLYANSTSGLPVAFSVSGPATLAGTMLTVTGSGTVTVTATQNGNGSYAAAPAVARSFVAP